MRFLLLLLTFSALASIAHAQEIKVTENATTLQIETDVLSAKVNKTGYVSGIAAGSLIDKKTGTHDLGFGLHIMDFLLGPGWKDDGYTRDQYHGNLPKHYGHPKNRN